MRHPRKDDRGILAAARLRDKVRFRRFPATGPLDVLVEHFWLIDWDLAAPHEQHVVPHPCVNLAWMNDAPALVHGVEHRLSSVKLLGRGRVFGVQFRPGGFRPFVDRPVSDFTDEAVPVAEVLGPVDREYEEILRHGTDDDARVAAATEYLVRRHREPEPANLLAMRLANLVRTDRTLLRVDRLAEVADMSERALQRLFGEYIGVNPKWVIRRYRIHEAITQATTGTNWARLAAALGYSDQAHLARDFQQTTGMSPTEYARWVGEPG
ncbi:helix-turn-helix domain-containing protein [Stackebrandtia albiflava]|uniref:helix-turn-helix domain-containing protein n=1 Tax=Stackebrandtia albiflava TaxID=406432 RepID=UPI0011BEE1B1|nr:helix-turn-helix domain-containing protein [Stackebrandtia albiflava]